MSVTRTTRAVALISAAAIAAVLITGCNGARSQLAGHIKRGQNYFDAGDFVKANIEFRNAMQIDPKDLQARTMAAATAEKQGQLPRAYVLLKSVVDDHPNNIEARTALSRLLVTAGDAKQGLEILKPALTVKPNDATLLAIRSAGKVLLKDAAGARADADQALSIDPKSEDAIDLRAGLYRADGNLPAAIKLVGDAAAAQPNVPGFHEVLVSLYQATNQPTLVEGQLRALVRLKPDELGYRSQLALYLSQSKRLDDAQKVLDDAVDALPKSNAAKLLRVKFLVQARSRDAGERALRQYIAADAHNYDLRLALGTLLETLGETDKAVTVYTEVLQGAGTEASGLGARDRLADIAVQQHRESDAQRYLAEVLKVSPTDNDALFLRARLSQASGDTAGAISDFRAILRDQPQSAPVNRFLAEALIFQGNMALAEGPLRTALASAPADSSLRVALSQLLFGLQHPDQGIAVLQDGIKAQPTDFALNEALVKAYLSQKNPGTAAKVVDAFREAKPNDAAPYLLSASLARAGNRPDEEEATLEKALQVQPRAYDVLSAMVHLQLQRGHAAKAVSRLQGLMATDPKDALIPNLLGELYLQQKNFEAAQQVFGLAIANQPNWWKPQRNLALSKIGAHDVPGAIEAYQNGLKLAPTEAMMLVELGTVYQSAGRIDDALKLYDSWVARDPTSQLAANNLAMLLVSYRTDKASLDRALALTTGFANADNGALLDTAGWVQFKRGDYSQSLPVLQHAAALTPQSHEVRFHLGMAELRSGQPDRARADLESALTGASTFVGEREARAALATLKNQAG